MLLVPHIISWPDLWMWLEVYLYISLEASFEFELPCLCTHVAGKYRDGITILTSKVFEVVCNCTDPFAYCRYFVFVSVCNFNVHHKCQKNVPHLCGVNQKLLSEAMREVEVRGAKQSMCCKVITYLKGNIGFEGQNKIHSFKIMINTYRMIGDSK